DHRERQVDAQRDRRAGAVLGLGDGEIVRLQPDGTGAPRTLGRLPKARVAHRADRVDRALVAELPAQHLPGQLVRAARAVAAVLATGGGVEMLEDLAQRRLAESPQRLRGEHQLPGLVVQVALALQLALEL